MARSASRRSKVPEDPGTDDLFAVAPARPAPKVVASGRKGRKGEYSAEDIEVLEGLEPVRRRPGMYIGGTDEAALHHLAAEALDNAMDEAVAGHATWIEVEIASDGALTVRDNGRGIPVDPHPKFKDKSALEVVMCMLHSGGKFGGEVYKTSGGLHGVGISVVNALSDRLRVEVAREGKLWAQEYSRGKPKGKLKSMGEVRNRRGTTVEFHPDPEIFGDKVGFKAARLYRMARSKAYLFRGVEIRWTCAKEKLRDAEDVPEKETFKFPGGLADFLKASVEGRETVVPSPFVGEAKLNDDEGRVEWALTWPVDGESFLSSYCNTVPTPQGGTHEAGLRLGLVRALKAYGDLVGNRKAKEVTGEDVLGAAWGVLSVFIKDPQFQGQTKEKLSNPAVARLVETSIKDHFDHFLSGDPQSANALLEWAVERAEERLKKREDRDLLRKTPTRKLRLPGKLADCTNSSKEDTEIFIVEGDSAGGSAKQARDRATQAVLPLRGKILNVASASTEKLRGNQELADLMQALGCGAGEAYDEAKLRYERVIIMTDADVDGAHIASLLMTFFFREMRELIAGKHLYLALPPLYRLTKGGDTAYARDEAHRDELLRARFKGAAGVEVSRFKGLGEMPAAQLRETTMDPAKRALLRVILANGEAPAAKPKGKAKTRSRARSKPGHGAEALVEQLMGRRPELRLEFIQAHATEVEALDV
jgi:topoisomerase-4 subunit B